MTGLALGRSLGCLVAARLAARHGITVRLRAGDGEGVAAYVILPSHLLAEDPVEPLVPSAATPLADDGRTSVPTPAPESLNEALPRSDFDAGLQALLAEEGDPSRSRTVEEAPDSVPVASSLTRRVPGATTEVLPEPLGRSHPRRRSPDEVRNLLSRYRSGLEAGRSADESVAGPPDEERS